MCGLGSQRTIPRGFRMSLGRYNCSPNSLIKTSFQENWEANSAKLLASMFFVCTMRIKTTISKVWASFCAIAKYWPSIGTLHLFMPVIYFTTNWESPLIKNCHRAPISTKIFKPFVKASYSAVLLVKFPLTLNASLRLFPFGEWMTIPLLVLLRTWDPSKKRVYKQGS